MGYDIERFVDPVNDGLLCCICRDVLEDPVQTPCEHVFCRRCIEGWLVHETKCPEDRTTLSNSQLKPLFRYMKNDLDKLQVHCKNQNIGCPKIVRLEFLESHESECEYGTVTCPNEMCSSVLSRKQLSSHLTTCRFQSQECPKGCGMLIVTHADNNHNCIAELRTALDVLRSEMECKVEDQKREIELRLNAHRRHMVQKESAMQTQIDDLKSEVSRLSEKIKLLMDLELQRRQEYERLQLENRELMDLIRIRGHPSTDDMKASNTKKLSKVKVTTI